MMRGSRSDAAVEQSSNLSGLLFVICVTVSFISGAGVYAAQQGWSGLQKIKVGDKASTLNSVFYDGKYLWVVGADGLVLRSGDSGQSFEDIAFGSTENFNDIYVRKDRIWMVGDGGAISLSTDGGRSFTNIRYMSPRRDSSSTGASSSPDLYSVQFSDKNRGFIVGDQGLIAKSTDGGYTWASLESRTQEQLFHLSIRGDRGWVVGTGGTILHTDDGGDVWYPQSSGTDRDLNRVYFVTDKIGIITGDEGLLLRTENGGARWERVASGIDKPLFGVSFIDKKTGWVVGYQGAVIRTYDGGETWIRQESSTNIDLFGVSFSRNGGFAIGRGGMVLRYYEKR